MFSLPNLAPQDSHTLWYTATNAHPRSLPAEPIPTFDNQPASAAAQAQHSTSHRRHALHRTPLARLRLDEEYIERRKQNVSSYGSSWIKPPGISKSLHQIREERREFLECQEAMRREQMAQELAEAEAEAVEGGEMGLGVGGDELEEEGRDLDDEVPEADTTGMDDEDDEDDDDDEDNEDDTDDEAEVPRGVLASRMPDDVYREALVRGEQARTTGFGGDGGSTIDGEDESQMLHEGDLVHEAGEGLDGDMDMGADLDADIPDAESAGGYEHTDTEEELTSSDEEDSVEEGQGMTGARSLNAASSMVRSDGTQNSMDLSSLMSRSSQVGSSPQQWGGIEARRRSRQ